MRVKYLKKRKHTYWYQRFILKALSDTLGTGVYSRSLETRDLAIAAAKVAHTTN
jgi:hypothetical protein